MPTLVLNVQRTRPLEALELLKKNLPCDEAGLAQWRHWARVAAVMGSCPRSIESFKSGTYQACCMRAAHGFPVCIGLRHWIRYVEITHGEKQADEVAFPPNLGDVLGWSNTFKSVCCQCVWTLRRLLSFAARCFGTFANYLGHLRGACHAMGCDAPLWGTAP